MVHASKENAFVLNIMNFTMENAKKFASCLVKMENVSMANVSVLMATNYQKTKLVVILFVRLKMVTTALKVEFIFI